MSIGGGIVDSGLEVRLFWVREGKDGVDFMQGRSAVVYFGNSVGVGSGR
jgi:hypothetical protein